MNCQSIYSSDSHLESGLWTIVLALPDARYRIIAQFCNQQDAEDRLRFLRRSVPAVKFALVFNPPTVQQSSKD